VPQDDLLFEDLTVRENLDYNARLCLAELSDDRAPGARPPDARELHQEEIADLKVGDPLAKTISGGQRKRLNIALELIREPSVLFVDEPTSGLSSADSDVVMGLLKAQAARGRLVIVIIHQPSSNLFRQFDALWILDKGGVPIYMGHPLEAARHFREAAHLAGADRGVCPECGNVHPEQIFSIIESKAIDADGRFTRERRFPPEFWHEPGGRARRRRPPVGEAARGR
jgi:ABC transport system ATP-binding/permease protein